MKGFFVTGTSTGIGKSVVSIAIMGALKSMGLNVCGMKPVESGCIGGIPSDGMALLAASGADEPIERVVPYRLAAPLAPLVAARDEGMTIEPKVILDAAEKLASRYDALVVEGAGGLLVPVAEGGYMIRDLARDMGLPLVVAATMGLGTINHTLLTLEAARSQRLPVAGVILNAYLPEGGDTAEHNNPALLVELIGEDRLLGVLPHIKGAAPFDVMQEGARLLKTKILKSFL